MESELKDLLFIYALENAVKHKSMPKAGTVMGMLMGKHPEFRARAKEVSDTLKVVLSEVEDLNSDERYQQLKARAPELVEGKKEKRKRQPNLPDLERTHEGVVMRFAPNPSGPLHLGHARAVYLNDYYVRKYGGRFVLRLEDTDPRRVDPENYQLILDDAEWLGLAVTDIVYQSDRLEIYYDHCAKLIERGGAYLCTCDAEYFRDLKMKKTACLCREQTIEENLELWIRMLEGDFCEGMITVRVKTDMNHPDPAMRDFSIFRIVDSPPHPRVDAQVYPMYNFSVVVDDHLMGITHVIRGKDHIANTRRQEYIYDYFGWSLPLFQHYGRLSIGELVLSTSAMKEGIRSGEFTGWDDIRLGTIRSIARRGICAEAVRRAMVDIGIGGTDITFSWENLFAQNKAIVDPKASRYFFVPDPTRVDVADAPHQTAMALIHPNDPDRGYRHIHFTGSIYLSKGDIEGREMVRLKDLFNVAIEWEGTTPVLRYAGDSLEEARRVKAPIVQWLPDDAAIACTLRTPEGDLEGYCEPGVANEEDAVVQFERIGFARIDAVDGAHIMAYFAHR